MDHQISLMTFASTFPASQCLQMMSPARTDAWRCVVHRFGGIVTPAAVATTDAPFSFAAL
jgi:hypothetical protein